MWTKISQFISDVFFVEQKAPIFTHISKDLTKKYKQELDILYLDKVIIVYNYDTVFKKYFLDFKYNRKKQNITLFTSDTEATCEQYFYDPYDIVTSVPTTYFRQICRGYNQSYELAKVVAKKLKQPFIPLFTTKFYKTSQTKLHKQERKTNTVSKFFLLNTDNIRDKKVILVDDIISTGSTANELAKLLKEQWVKEVTWLFLASRENRNL